MLCIYLTTLLSVCLCFALTGTEEPVLILNAANEEAPPRHFRTCNDPYENAPANSPTRKGLDGLNLSGSAQFSQLELAAVVKRVGTPLYDVDLRQEFHGFLNGAAVSWFVSRDWINRGKSDSAIAAEEKALLKKLQLLKSVTLAKVEKKNSEGGILESTQHIYEVKTVQDEQELAASAGVGYLRLYVTDHLVPPDDAVNRFVQFYRTLPANAWLHIHCAGGDGRTTTFMAIVDMLRNAKEVAFEEILSRQYLLGGIDLTHLGPPEEWKYPYAAERLEFLKKFYAYARENRDDFKTLWSLSK